MEAQRVQTSHSATDNRKAGNKKGAPTPPQEPSPQPAVEKSPEEVKRRAERKRIKQEFTAALKREEHAVKLRLELIKAHVLRTVSSLQQRAEQAYRNMEELKMNSIDQLTELVQQHIENACGGESVARSAPIPAGAAQKQHSDCPTESALLEP